MLSFPLSRGKFRLMPTRRAALSLTPPPKLPRNAAKARTREALVAALAERERELAEALERQKAAAEVLSAISKSVADTAPVFETILDACQRLFGSEEIGVYTIGDDDMVRVAAWRGPRAEEVRRDVTPVGESVTGRIIRERRTHHIPDLAAEPDLSPTVRDRVNRLGGASLLYAPMLSEDRGLGSILVVRSPPKPFAEREKALLESFADQAAIAIQNARLFRETQDALQQQTATADVLKIISRSAFDLNQATTTILAAAAKLCRAPLATLHLRDGEVCRLVTQFGLPEAFERQAREAPIPVRYPLHSRRPARAGEVAHFPDAWTDPDYLYKATARLGGYRAIVVIPLMREDELVGIFSLGRPEPEPFTPGQIKLVQTFADQAAIAIENARLFNEVKAKTDDLSEALEQQTATADVLKVISRSVLDVDSVLQTLIDTAVRLARGSRGTIFIQRGDVLVASAFHSNVAAGLREYLATTPWRLDGDTPPARAAREGRVVHVPDLSKLADETTQQVRKRAAYGAGLWVPLIGERQTIGVFGVPRDEPVAFTDREIEIVKTFADQAVIAIENARLFDEVQAKTRDLEEALQQQTATADVLKVISRSAFDLQTVFDTLLGSAVALSGADSGVLGVRDGDAFRAKSFVNKSPDLVRFLSENPITPGPGSVMGRVALSGRIEWIEDTLADSALSMRNVLRRTNDDRALVGVPLLRDARIEGAIILGRSEPGRFSARSIDLAQTFADQAVIAIQNVRLFDEVQARTRDLSESLHLQTATSDVLKVISRSAFDLQAVFGTLISSAVELCSADGGTICVRDREVFRFRASAGAGQTEALTKYLEQHPATPGPGSTAGRVLLSGKVEAIPDCLADPDYVIPIDSLSQSVRSILGVPLLGKEGIEGALVITRREPGHFTERQIEIVQSFADQAVIAIENVRLFDEVQARTKELAASLDDLRKAQDRLIQSEKLASLGQLTAGIAHEIKNPLNFINNFSALSRELIDELRETLEKSPLDETHREEAEDLIGMVAANLDKVVSHGKRADSIVKNMLLHSREGSGERTSVNVNAMLEEALNLAYHGARAEKPGFNVTIAKSLDDKAGAAELYPQEMTRVLLNLISNAFYATTKRKQAEANGDYEPTITVSTRDLGHSVEIAIRDNGPGIPDEVKAKMFNPFFTTKPAGEGTGLGLSLSHDIVVKQHGGTLEVATESGSYTQFTIIVPRAGAPT